jgi:hypothetical protein
LAKLEGAYPDAPKIFGSAGALPSRKPFAIRYSPLAAVLAEVGGYKNKACYLGCALRVES